MSFVFIGKLGLCYRDSGGAGRPAVLLAHPLGMSQAVWDGVVRRLSPQFRLITWDLPGHGASAPINGPMSAGDLADQALGLLDHLGVDVAHFVGTSIGGVVGQALLERAPQRFGEVVLTNTGAVIGSAEAWRERAARVRAEGLATLAPELVVRWFAARFQSAEPATVLGWQTQLARCDDESYARLCELLATTDFRDRLGGVYRPVRLVAGGEDPATPVSTLAALAEELPQAELETFQGVGHVPSVECEALFTEYLLAWLGEPPAVPVSQEDGLTVRKQVLGEAHVERSMEGASSLDRPFQDLITRYAWGEVWGNPDLVRQERSMVTLGILAALGRDGELTLHLNAAHRLGLSEDKLRQVLMHVAVYAGVPAANHAFKLAKQNGWGSPEE